MANEICTQKHSSGDLHSRLKTRKILGVGETDNGDVHRSKISQLLGHNEHLYVKFPRGFWMWYLVMAALFSVQGVVCLLFPEKAVRLFLFSESPMEKNTHFATRLQGSALLALALCLWTVVPKIQCSYSISSIVCFLWNFQGTIDKGQARSALTAVMLYQGLQFSVCIMSLDGDYVRADVIVSLFIQAVMVVVNMLYRQAIGGSNSGLRKSSSYKDLTSADRKDSTSCIKEEKKEM